MDFDWNINFNTFFSSTIADFFEKNIIRFKNKWFIDNKKTKT